MGPLDKKGKPISMKKGRDFIAWVNAIKRMGYSYDEAILNSANYGAHTKRKRLFGIFSNGELPIVWPTPSHAEFPTKDMFQDLKPWNPVRECLNFNEEGQSIFTRKKPLVEATLKRILAGLEKYVATGDGIVITNHGTKSVFNAKYYGTGKNVESIDQPSGTLRTKDGHMMVQSAFLDKGFSGPYNHQSINTPAGSIPTKDHYALVKSSFLDKQYSGSANHESINKPTGSLLANPKQCLVQSHFIARQFSNGGQHSSINKPAGSVTTVPKMDLISAFIMNPQFNSKGGSIDKPCFTLIARMDKSAPSLVQSRFGTFPEYMKLHKSDTPMLRAIKEFCLEHGISDITTRMLRVPELKKIQGFGEEYTLLGTQADQKKFIGNSVPPDVVQAMMEALANELAEPTQEAMVA